MCVCACASACVRDVFAIYDNNISPRLIMIIIKIIILYFTQIRHTDDFPSTGTRLAPVYPGFLFGRATRPTPPSLAPVVHTFEAVAGSWRSVSLKYIGMICLNVGEMCFIPMNIHNEQFNGVRQLRWQHLSPVVSTFSTSNRLLSSFS